MFDIEAEWNSFLNGNETQEYWSPYPQEEVADTRDEWELDSDIDVVGLTNSDLAGAGSGSDRDYGNSAYGVVSWTDVKIPPVVIIKNENNAANIARTDPSPPDTMRRRVIPPPVLTWNGLSAGGKTSRTSRCVTTPSPSPSNNARHKGAQGSGIGMLSVPSATSSLAPEPLPLYISTKSVITYFNTPIDIHQMFWNLEVHPYTTAEECVIKKEIKLTSNSPEEVEEIKRKISDIPYVKEHIITHLNAADGRTKFKDVRKIIVGLSKKDITSCRIKQKGAFYNCLVMIMRIQMDKDGPFREVHVKVFNTGKIEIPGIQTDHTLQYILDKLIGYLQPLSDTPLSFQDTTRETVLINSNFNCRFYINREAMFSILRSKYRVQCWYDPCCYPGIRCKYTDEACGLVDISFMIFRTGSVLIVGKCDEEGIFKIYEYVKNILRNEFENVHQPLSDTEQLVAPPKKKTIRKRKIYVEDYSLGQALLEDENV
jgi:TATA-box binding protein (TBP) (component of TFIID and TFIIIB)